MNILTPDEEVEHLNLVEDLLAQLKLCERVPSQWNWIKKKQLMEKIEKVHNKMYIRMQKAQQKLGRTG
jgi:hypothetical protein